MRKWKTALISAVLIAGIGAGAWYGARRLKEQFRKPVEVALVSTYNQYYPDSYGGSSDSLSGTIISKDTSTYPLDAQLELKEVYVKTGDTVKTGDKLFEYNMELQELQAEAQELTLRGLNLRLDNMKKILEQLKAGTMPEAYLNGDYGSGSVSSDVGYFSDYTSSKDEGEDLEARGADTADVVQGNEVTDGGGELIGDSDVSDIVQDDGSAVHQDGNSGNVGADSGEDADGSKKPASTSDAISDPDSDRQIADGAQFDNNLSYNDGKIGYELSNAPDAATLQLVNGFLNSVNDITEAANVSLEMLDEDAIDDALDTYRTMMSLTNNVDIIDVYGNHRTLVGYTLDPNIAVQTGDATASVLATAYDRLTVYKFICRMQELNPDGRSFEEFSLEELKKKKDLIDEALTAFYAIQSTAFNNGHFSADYAALNGDQNGGRETLVEQLFGMIYALNNESVLKDPERETADFHDETEPDNGWDDGGGGSDYTQQDIDEAIENMNAAIRDTELTIREAKVKLKDLQEQLERKVVKSTQDGVVKQAGTIDASGSQDSQFVIITGEAGLYVQGTLNEFQRQQFKVGDTLMGTDLYYSGAQFPCEITEISEYPQNSDNSGMYYYGGSGNQNASQYQFYAYIPIPDGLTEQTMVSLSPLTTEQQEEIMLPRYFIRTEASGRKYAFVQGKDGLLEKRYVESEVNEWYDALEIRKGLKEDDLIAFPYGDDVVEGAKTIEVDSLSAVDMY